MAEKFAALPPALADTRPRASKLDLSTSTACAPSEERPQRLVLESWRSQDSQCHFQPPAKSESVGSCLPASAPSRCRAQCGNQEARSWRARIEAVVRLAIVTRSHVLQRRRCPHPHCAKVPLALVRNAPHHDWRSCSLRDLLDLQQCLVQLAVGKATPAVAVKRSQFDLPRCQHVGHPVFGALPSETSKIQGHVDTLRTAKDRLLEGQRMTFGQVQRPPFLGHNSPAPPCARPAPSGSGRSWLLTRFSRRYHWASLLP